MFSTDILPRVLHMKLDRGANSELGTAFTFEKEGDQFLATTRHLFRFNEAGDTVEFFIFKNDDWKHY
jgi:hypothetical protein